MQISIEIHDIAAEGQGVGKYGDRVVFVKGAIPGDLVLVSIFNKKKRYWLGQLLEVIRPSADRKIPFCNHFGTCGGCQWQQLDYSKQLHYKQKQVQEQFKRIGGIDVEILPIIGSEKEKYYRNKLEYSFGTKWLTATEIASTEQIDRRALGFHAPERFDKIVPIEHCFLQSEISNQIRNAVRDYVLQKNIPFYNSQNKTGVLRNLMIRGGEEDGQLMVVLVYQLMDDPKEHEQIQELLAFLVEKFPSIDSLLHVNNKKPNDNIADQKVEVFKGKPQIAMKMEELIFEVSAQSFYQTNSLQAYKMYSIVRDFMQVKPSDVIYDLYTGTGTIAQFVGKNAQKVIGIEYIETAIADAQKNAIQNGLEHLFFFAGDMKKVLTLDFVKENGFPDGIIIDPPRAGMDPQVIECLLQIASPKMIYVSCNPATQARDLALMQNHYAIEKVQPMDLFPHTQHVENIVLLIKK